MPLVRRITMQNFRGSAARSSIEFDSSKPIVLIFGENGTGKSTVVDAIDLVCNGLPGSISERGGTSVSRHLPTIGTDFSAMEVVLELEDGARWTGRITKGGKLQVSGPQRKPGVHILRRRSLLKLTESTAGERYEQLKGLIDVEPIEKSEKRLADAFKQANDQLDGLSRRMVTEESRLHDLWTQAGAPGRGAEAWAREQVAADLADVRQQAQARQQQLNALDEFLIRQEDVKTAEEGDRTMRRRSELLTAHISASAQAQSHALEALLVQAERHVLEHQQAEPTPQACPICEQSVSLPDLGARLSERLGELRQVQGEYGEYRAAQEDERTAAHHLDQCQRLRDDAARALRLLSSAEPTQALLAVWKVELDALQSTLEYHRALTVGLEALSTLRADALSQQDIVSRLDAMLNVLRDTRKTFTQRIFDEVAGEAQRLYSLVHPGEPLGLKSLHLDPARRASLQQIATFHGHDDVHPQGFYSEAHLDTLGFCFWLAVVKRSDPNAIIVLDDVFTSVDAAHLGRIDQMLRSEIKSRARPGGTFAQIIVVTHYRGWLEKLRAEMPGNAGIEIKELVRWTITHGIRVHNTLPYTAELRAKLDTPYLDRQGAASQAGVILEQLLDDLTLTLRMDFPRTPRGEYTIEPLLKTVTSATKKFATLHPGTSDSLPWPPVLQRLNDLAFIRNQVGAHFSVAALDVSDQDVTELGETVLALAHLMTCPTCGERAYRKDHRDSTFSCGESCQQTRIRTA